MSTNRGNGQHRARNKVQSLGAAVKLFQSPMPSDVHGGRTTKGSKRQDEGGLAKQLSRRFTCICGHRFGVNDYDAQIVTCPKCGNTGIDTIKDQFEIWPTPQAYSHNKGSSSPGITKLDCAVRPELNKHIYPTPRSEDGQSCGAHRGKPDTLTSFVEMFPTPKASSAGPDFAKEDRSATGLSLQTHVALQSAGTLSPDWVELLMGWPRGWSSLAPMTREQFATWTADWPADWERDTPRVSDGVPDRVSRLEAIGDGQIPLCAATAFRVLLSPTVKPMEEGK